MNKSLLAPAILVAAALLLPACGAAPAVDQDEIALATAVPATERVRTISHGERVDLSLHLEEGTWTVVEFYADW